MSQEQEYQDAIRDCLKTMETGRLYPHEQLFMNFDGAKCRVNIGYMIGGRSRDFPLVSSLSVTITDPDTDRMIWVGPAPNNIDVIKTIVVNSVVSSVLNS